MSSTIAPRGSAGGAAGDVPRSPGETPGSSLDADNPWPGLAAFTEADHDRFHGRDAEKAELLRLVRREILTVLFGMSGLGKTSLLRAGLFPELHKDSAVPVYLRLDHDETAAHPVQQILETIRRGAGADVEAPSVTDGDTLWEYFHRNDAVFWRRTTNQNTLVENSIVMPVLVFDQFEEIFTLGRSTPARARRTHELLTQLGDLIESRPPVSVKERLDAAPDTAQAFAFGRHIYRVIISLREDFLADLEDLRQQIPSISNRMHLRHMTGETALQVVRTPGRQPELVTADIAERIVRFVASGAHPPQDAGADGEPAGPLNELRVEPALLSLFCRRLNDERRARGDAQISAELLRQSQTSILQAFYEDCMRDRRPEARAVVEDKLVTVSGYRDSVALDNLLDTGGVTSDDIDTLVERRLLRPEERGGIKRVELTHDVLTAVVRASRDRRQQREALARAQRQAEEEQRRRVQAEQREAEKRRQLRQTYALLALAVIGFIATLVGFFVARSQRARAIQTLALSNYHDGLYRLQEGHARDALAYLARGLELAPSSSAMQTAVFSTLVYTEWPSVILWHANDVAAAAFSPDGTHVVTAAVDGTARLWDAHTGAAIGAPMRHGYPLNSAVFNADGSSVVTASEDSTARLWDAHTGAQLGGSMRHQKPVYAAAFSADGSRVVTASEDGSARVWDAHTGAFIVAFLGHTAAVRSATFSLDGARVVTASTDGTARLWDAYTGDALGNLMQHEEKVYSAAFNPDGTRVVTASADGTARVWDGHSGDFIGKRLQHAGPVFSARFNADGTRIVTASEDGTARLWDVRTGDSINLPHSAAVRSAVFSSDGTHVVTASADGTVRLWDTTSGRPVGPPRRHEGSVWSAAFSADGTRIVSASADHSARVWETRSGAALGEPLAHEKDVQWAGFSPDGRRVVTASEDGSARLWDARSGALLHTLEHAATYAAAFNPDGSRLVSGSEDGTVRLWDVDAGTLIREVGRHHGAVRSAAFNRDGNRIVTASEDQTALVWDASSGADTPIGTLQHDDIVLSAAFSPNGESVLTAAGDRAHLWDARTGKEIPGAPLKHDVAVWAAAFSPDGTRIVTASDDKTARVWDIRSRQVIGEPLRHDDVVRTAAFDPDGELIVTGSVDGTVRLWEARTGAAVSEPLQHGDSVWSAAFSPDGTRVVTASSDHTARLWQVSAGQAIAANALTSFAEAVAGRRVDDRGLLTDVEDRSELLTRLHTQGMLPPPGEPLTFAGLLHWFFADRGTRAISPGSAMTVAEYDEVSRRLTAGH